MTLVESVALKVESLHLGFPGRRVLQDFSLQLKRDEILGLIGKVGSGKTQLLRAIAGLSEPQSGSVWLGSPGERQVGYVFQEDNLIPWLTIRETLKLCRRSDRSVTLGSIEESWLALKPAQLSGGMRQRVNLARGFMNHDQVVLMDEPFSALDPGERRALQIDFLKLQSQVKNSVIFVTHDLPEALLLCHRLVFLSKKTGRIECSRENPFQGNFGGILGNAEVLSDPSYQSLLKTFAQLFESPVPKQ